jgi:3-phenylpropionate/trans-cinnamate dioxygenase ferredoxin component
MFVNVAEVDKLARGTAKLIHVEGLSIALFNADGAFYALEDSCPFDGASLSHGWVTGSVVECRGDRARFFLPTGECLRHLKGKISEASEYRPIRNRFLSTYDKD